MRASLLPRRSPIARVGCLPYALVAALVVALLLAGGGAARYAGASRQAPTPFAVAFDTGDTCTVQGARNGTPEVFPFPCPAPSPSPTATGVPTWTPTIAPSVAPSPMPSSTPSASSSPSASVPASASPVASPSSSPPSPSPGASPTTSPSSSPTGALVVGSGGYPTINAAIAAAPAGSTIRVKAGTYAEQVSVTKTLALVAYGDGPASVDGGCSRLFGIVITANDVRVSGLGVRRTNDAGITIGVNGSSAHPARATIDANTVQDFDCNNGPNAEAEAGVACWYCGPGQTITNNTITRRVTLNGGNNIGGGSNGIYFKGCTTGLNRCDGAPTGGGHLISRNTIKGGYDCIGSQLEDDPHGGFDKDTTISFNTIDICYDDGIQVEGGTANVRVTDNTIAHAASGTANAPNLIGPIYFERNVITQGTPGNYGTINCFKIGNGGSGTAYYTGNKCILPMVGTEGANGWSQTNSQVTSIVARNNQINVSRYVIELNSVAPGATFSFDGDCLWTSDTGRFVETPQGKFLTIQAWRAATGQEPNGTQSATCGQ